MRRWFLDRFYRLGLGGGFGLFTRFTAKVVDTTVAGYAVASTDIHADTLFGTVVEGTKIASVAAQHGIAAVTNAQGVAVANTVIDP